MERQAKDMGTRVRYTLCQISYQSNEFSHQIHCHPLLQLARSVSSTALVGIIAGNIFFPAVDSLQIDLKASQAMVAR